MSSGKDIFTKKIERGMKLEENTNKFEKGFNTLLEDSDKDTFTKLELSKALILKLDDIVTDWMLMRQAINSEISKLEKQLANEEENCWEK